MSEEMLSRGEFYNEGGGEGAGVLRGLGTEGRVVVPLGMTKVEGSPGQGERKYY